MADGVRFELTEGRPSPVFKTGALNHSTTHPDLLRARDVALAEDSEKGANAFADAAKLRPAMGANLRDIYRNDAAGALVTDLALHDHL